jgi:flagellar hook-associated protein 1 FlgK
VVINARTGSIVLNQAVTLGPCAIAHGNLSVSISSTPGHQPAQPLSTGGQTVVAEKTNIQINQEPGILMVRCRRPQLADVVRALNCAGRHAAGPAGHPAGHQGRRRAECRAGGDLSMACSPHCPVQALAADVKSLDKLKLWPARTTPAAHQGSGQTVRVAVHARADQEHARGHHEIRHARQAPAATWATDLLDQQLSVQMSGMPAGCPNDRAPAGAADGRHRPVAPLAPGRRTARPGGPNHQRAPAGPGMATSSHHAARLRAAPQQRRPRVEQDSGIPAQPSCWARPATKPAGASSARSRCRRHAVVQPVRHQGRQRLDRQGGRGHHHRIHRWQPRKVVAKFRAYDSYEESFRGLRTPDQPEPALRQGQPADRIGAGPLPTVCSAPATPPTRQYAAKLSRAINIHAAAAARQVVIARADEMTARLREASSRLDLLGEGLNEELRLGVEAVNSRASQIASLNSQISALQGSGHTPNDLLDQRDQLVSEINSYVNTTSIPSPDGSISVFVGGTQPLVLAGHSMKLSTDRDLFDPTKLGLAIETNAGPAALNDTQLTGGSVTGLLQFQRTDMVTARNQLGRLTLGTATLMNEQHRLGLDLKGNPGSDLFKLAALPDGLASSKNTGNATVSMAVADATAMAPSDYELRFESGTVDVVRLSDGQVTHVGGLPARVDGIDISLGGTPQVGDRFLLQPFSMAAGSIATAISSPTSLAVATPVTAVPGSTNKGDLAASALTATLADGNMTAPVQITFTGTSSFDVTGAGTGDPTGLTYVSGNAITFNGWTLKLTGTPQPGDTLQILPNSSGARNAGQAQGFLDLRDTPVFDGVSLSDGYASVLAEIGTRVQSAKLASGVSGAMAAQAVQSQSSVAGVNLDEEAARLLQFQQSYQAAARILQTAQSVFDSLMQGFR